MMKNFLIVFSLLLAVSFNVQGYYGMQNDNDRIAISPKVDEAELTGQARNILLTRMNNIINLNGLAATDEGSYFSMIPVVTVLTQDITATAPPMHAVTLLVSFTVADSYSGAVFGETSVEVKGVDRSKERAFTQALSSINPRMGQFKVFMDRSKDKIMDFYNTECDILITTAQGLVGQGREREALKVLNSVPTVSRLCHGMAMEYAAEIGPVAGYDEPEQKPVLTENEVDYQQSITVQGGSLKGKLRDLEVQITSVEFTGNDIDVNIVIKNNKEDYQSDLQNARFFDKDGKEIVRHLPSNLRFVNLIRGVPASMTFSFQGNNLDLIDTMRVLELNFKSGTLRFENVQVTKNL